MRSPLSLLDVKLGVRMLMKYPTLSIVGGLGMAVSTAVSVGFFAFMQAHIYPEIPLPEGNRIVALENRDTGLYSAIRESVHDFVTWRGEMRSVTDVSAFRFAGRDIIASDGTPEPVAVAEMTASGFTVARTAPLIGRYLTSADEAPGAPPVVVIGYEPWKQRFASDANVVGKQVRLDGTLHTIVGVMPEGFAFPFNHQYWTTFRADPSAYPRRKGPQIFVFGRLAPGATMESAGAELAVLGKRAAADFPASNATLVPVVVPYAHSLLNIRDMTPLLAVQMQAAMSLLLLVVALNVAVLVYARTATRRGELAVRNALGASRARIVRQLFVEGLVLSVVSAAAGLIVAQYGLRFANGLMESMDGSYGTPFWANYRLEPTTVLFTMGIAILTAVIVGILPALQATGRSLQDSLRQVSAGAGTSLGKTWTTLIVAQVAIAAFALPGAVSMGLDVYRESSTVPTYDASAFIATQISAAGSDSPGESKIDSARFGERIGEVMRHVAADPAVLGVTYSASLGRMGRVEVDGVTLPGDLQGEWAVESQGIAPDMLKAFGARTLAGRGFEAGDTDTSATSIVINASFARRAFGNTSALGKRLRYAAKEAQFGDTAAPPSRWYTIVGVVGDMAANALDPNEVKPTVYYPVGLGTTSMVELRVHTRGNAADFAPALRRHIAAVDPALRAGRPFTLDERQKQNGYATRLAALAIGLVLVSVTLLSGAGVYALTSFTVTRRRREIGIRTALGAGAGRVLRAIFARVARQIAIGLALGVGSAAVIDIVTNGALLGGRGALLLPIFAAIMTVVALAAAIGPASRGLRIDPAEALRAEA